MEKSIKNALCRSLRGCGINKGDTHEVVNIIEKWYNNNGVEWTIERLKSLRQWYESILAGSPSPAPWFQRTRAGYPKGIWSKVFRYRNSAKSLAVLSAGTVFRSKTITSKQRLKFVSALNAENVPLIHFEPSRGRKPLPLPDLTDGLLPPSFDAISGKSIPLMPSDGKIFIESDSDRVRAYCESWNSVPLPTLRLLRRERLLDQVPEGQLGEGGVDGIFAIMPEQQRFVGHIGCIQEPEFKARWIANPNRISQHYMGPLGHHWYAILRRLSTDCTFNQDKGIQWVQGQLTAGVQLSGADLTSATDLLSMDIGIRLLSALYLYRDWDNPDHWTLPVEKTYRSHIQHFYDISRSEWCMPDGEAVKWKQGQPLGTYPSFALLALTNNALGRLSCRDARIPLDSFRVIGDDIIMDSRALPHYEKWVKLLGGVINHQKTLTSSKCAEFAGRIILPNRSMPKRIKFKELSDNSFMEVVSSLGDTAKSLLRPRQLKMYQEFKYVPGIVVPGPYPKNSFGIPLSLRYQWYLMKTGLSDERVEPDKEKLSSMQMCMKIYWSLSEIGQLHLFEYGVPYAFAEDFQSSLANEVCRKGDPRLSNGKSFLEVLEEVSSQSSFQSWLDFIDNYESLDQAISTPESEASSHEENPWIAKLTKEKDDPFSLGR